MLLMVILLMVADAQEPHTRSCQALSAELAGMRAELKNMMTDLRAKMDNLLPAVTGGWAQCGRVLPGSCKGWFRG